MVYLRCCQWRGGDLPAGRAEAGAEQHRLPAAVTYTVVQSAFQTRVPGRIQHQSVQFQFLYIRQPHQDYSTRYRVPGLNTSLRITFQTNRVPGTRLGYEAFKCNQVRVDGGWVSRPEPPFHESAPYRRVVNWCTNTLYDKRYCWCTNVPAKVLLVHQCSGGSIVGAPMFRRPHCWCTNVPAEVLLVH